MPLGRQSAAGPDERQDAAPEDLGGDRVVLGGMSPATISTPNAVRCVSNVHGRISIDRYSSSSAITSLAVVLPWSARRRSARGRTVAVLALDGPTDAPRYRCAMPVLRLDDVLKDVVKREALESGIRLVGVDGPSGSGKSTFARRLAARSQAPLIEIDDFVSWKSFAGWWPRLEKQVLVPLQSGSDAHYQVRDWKNDEFGTSLNGWKTVTWAPLVILEGVTCSRLAAADFLAFRIWVDAPPDLRLNRGVERDGETHRQLWLDWMKEEHRFFADDGTRARADLRVDGNPGVNHDEETEVVSVR